MHARTGCQKTVAPAFAAILALTLYSDAAAAQGQERLAGFIGAGAGVVPVYEGASDYKVLAMPAFDLRYGDFYLNFRNGLGVDVVNTDRFEAGLGATWVRGRRARDSPEGLGKVKNAIGSRAFVRYFLDDAISLTAGLTHSYGGTDGTQADLRLGYRFRPSRQVMLLPAASLTWANGKHMRRYFGIGEEQAARSGLPVFNADSGIKDVSVSLGVIYSLSRHWHVNANASLTRYLGDASDSPINERTWQPILLIGAGYRF